MPNIFLDVMKSKTDEELVEIVTLHRHQYVTEAMQAAEQEIQKRKLNISTIEENIKRIRQERNQKQPFNKKYLVSAAILLCPILFLFLSFHSEHLLGFFIVPVALLLILPSGIIGFQLATKEYGKTTKNEGGINHIVGVLQILLSILLIIAGIFGILLILTIINR